MLGNFFIHFCCHLLTFFLNYTKNYFSNTNVSNGLNPNKDQQIIKVCPKIIILFFLELKILKSILYHTITLLYIIDTSLKQLEKISADVVCLFSPLTTD